MFYGRHVGPALRLYLAIAGPAVAFVYGLGRFAGTDLALALIVGLVVSKPLGALTVAGTARRMFGESFERPSSPVALRRTPLERLRELTRSVLTAAAVLAGLGLIVAVVDDAYGTGRLATLGARPAIVIVSLATAVLALRAGVFLAERAAPGRDVLRGMTAGTLLRIVFAAPLVMLFFDETRTTGIVVAVLWLPVAAWIVLCRSFTSERRAFSEIDPALCRKQADKALSINETIGPAIVIAIAVLCLSLVALASIEFAFSIAGFAGPLSGPIGDSFDPEFFELNDGFLALGRSPLFAAASLASVLFAWQLARIAWFFVYVDARVRRDCWDMELLLAREARRLEDA